MNELIRRHRLSAACPEALHVIVDGEHAREPEVEQGLLAVEAELRRELVVHRASGQVAALAAALAGIGARRVIAIGDDRLINQMVNGLMSVAADRRPALGVVPLGRRGAIARAIAAPWRFEAALRDAIVGPARAVDVGCWSGRYFLDLVSGGAIYAAPGRARARAGLLGGLSYALAGVLGLPAMRPVELRLRGEGFAWAGSAYALAVANVGVSSGGFVLEPNAELADGELDLVVFPASLGLAEVLDLIADRSVAAVAAVRRFRSPWVELSAGAQLDLEVGGQLCSCRRARFELARAGLSLVCPRAGS